MWKPPVPIRLDLLLWLCLQQQRQQALGSWQVSQLLPGTQHLKPRALEPAELHQISTFLPTFTSYFYPSKRDFISASTFWCSRKGPCTLFVILLNGKHSFMAELGRGWNLSVRKAQAFPSCSDTYFGNWCKSLLNDLSGSSTNNRMAPSMAT